MPNKTRPNPHTQTAAQPPGPVPPVPAQIDAAQARPARTTPGKEKKYKIVNRLAD